MAKKISRKKIIQRIRKYLGQNMTDLEIIKKMGLRDQSYSQYKNAIYNADRRAIQNLDTKTIFAEYVMKNHQLVRELDVLKKKFTNYGQWTALVAAIKQKREIYNDVIAKGQDFGFIDRKVTELKVSSTMTFNTMSEEEMKAEIAQEVKAMKALATKQIDMRPELLDVTPDEVKMFAPAHVLKLPAPERRKKNVKRKVKLTFKRRT